MGEAIFLSDKKSVWKVLILHHKQTKRGFHLTVFVWIQISIEKKVFHDFLNFTSQGRRRLQRAKSMSSKWLMIRGNLIYIPLNLWLWIWKKNVLIFLLGSGIYIEFSYSYKGISFFLDIFFLKLGSFRPYYAAHE